MRYEITEEDKLFIEEWEREEKRYKSWVFWLRKHLPKGLIFSLPIGIFFFLMGPKRRAIVSHGDLTMIMISLAIIAIAYAIFKGYFTADRMETHYKILKLREAKNKEEKEKGD